LHSTIHKLLKSPALGVLAVSLAYVFAMHGLLAIQQRHFSDNPYPIQLLELGTTLLYIAALAFTVYLYRKRR